MGPSMTCDGQIERKGPCGSMLSYQHAYHAGNLADVHKHALLAGVLDYLTRKEKPLSYLESHAGRGLYDLGGAEADKTGEAAGGIGRVADWFSPDHPYRRALDTVRATHGLTAYPGSPLIAAALLRGTDPMWLAELHPQEAPALAAALPAGRAHILREDGLQMMLARTPPTPRRGVLLIDPSYEIKDDYARLPALLAQVHRKWNVGVLMLWYPILRNGAQRGMARALAQSFPGLLQSEVHFPPVREGHGMIGSGMVVVNAPWGLADMAEDLGNRFATL